VLIPVCSHAGKAGADSRVHGSPGGQWRPFRSANPTAPRVGAPSEPSLANRPRSSHGRVVGTRGEAARVPVGYNRKHRATCVLRYLRHGYGGLSNKRAPPAISHMEWSDWHIRTSLLATIVEVRRWAILVAVASSCHSALAATVTCDMIRSFPEGSKWTLPARQQGQDMDLAHRLELEVFAPSCTVR
jgi:hypothetical protein